MDISPAQQRVAPVRDIWILTIMRRSKADATTCMSVVTQNKFLKVQPLMNDWKITMPIQPVKAPTTDV